MELGSAMKTAAVGVASWFATRYGTDKPVETIDDIKLDDLRREFLRLDQQQDKLGQRLEEVEAEKRVVFRQLMDEPSRPKQERLALKIKQLDSRRKNWGRVLHVLHQQILVLDGFIQLKESKDLLKSSPLFAQVLATDLGTLEDWITNAMVDGVLDLQRLEEIATAFEQGEKIVGGMKVAEDIDDIISLAQEYKELENEQPGAFEEGYEKLDDRLTLEETEREPA